MPVVILVDEYDKPLLQAIDNDDLQDAYRATLKAFYSVLKSQDRYIRFAFLTGVTKFGKVSVFYDLNNLNDISMDARYQTICGITEEEMRAYFEEGIRYVADNNELTVEETCAKLKRRYDGYHFHQRSVGVYNPFSLLNTFSKGEFGSYWFETGTPTFLVRLLQRDKFYLPDLTQQQMTSDMLNSIDSINDNPIPIIYQSGYLTIKGYDKEFQIYTLGFPNEEVEEGFTSYLMPYYMNVGNENGPMYIRNFVLALRQGNPEAFMKRMQVLFADTDYKIVGDAELYFQNAFAIVTNSRLRSSLFTVGSLFSLLNELLQFVGQLQFLAMYGVELLHAILRQTEAHASGVILAEMTTDEAGVLERRDDLRGVGSREHHRVGNLARRQMVFIRQQAQQHRLVEVQPQNGLKLNLKLGNGLVDAPDVANTKVFHASLLFQQADYGTV